MTGIIITPVLAWAKANCHIKVDLIREVLAEFFGTLLLLFMVVGSGIFNTIAPDSHAVPVFGTVFGLMICIIVFGGITGALINPAVTIGLAVAGELCWVKVPFYIISQIIGGFLGTLLAYGLYRDHIFYGFYKLQDGDILTIPEFELKENNFLILNALTPQANGTFLGIGLLTEIILTAILLMSVMACIEQGKNMNIPKWYLPFMLALTVAALAMAHGMVTGGLLNPARDMCPRLAAWALGWERKQCFQNTNFNGNRQEWWIVGIFGPIIGAIIGVIFYSFFVGAQLLDNVEIQRPQSNQPEIKEDWRNTVFIPKTGAPITQNAAQTKGPQHVYPNQNNGINVGYPNTTNNVSVGYQNQNNVPNQSTAFNGQYNPGYTKDDGRQRRGYNY